MSEDHDAEQLDRLAAETLRAAIDREWRRSHRALTAIISNFGGGGLVEAIHLWCDALINHMGGHGPDKLPIAGIRLEAAGTGRVGGIDTVSTELGWAVQLITARQLEDAAQCEALLMVLAGCNSYQFGRYIQALLNVTSQTLAGHLKTCPVGFGGMHANQPRPAPGGFPPPPPGHTWN